MDTLSESLQQTIIGLRLDGLSIKKIASTLKISVSTASKYSRGIRNNNQQILSQDSQRIASLAASTKWQQLYHDVVSEAICEWPTIKTDCLMISLISLYWAEGRKRQKDFSISNSDIGIIKIAVMALQQYGITDELLSLSIYLYDGTNKDVAVSTWTKTLKLPIEHIYIRKWRSVKKKLYSKYGVGVLRVRNSIRMWIKMITWIILWREELGAPHDSQLSSKSDYILGVWQNGLCTSPTH